MHGSIHCKIIAGGWIQLRIEAPEDDSFTFILNRLKRCLHVLTYDQKYRKYKTSLHEMQRLSDLCEKHEIDLYVTDKVLHGHKRLLYKNKYMKRLRKNKDVDMEVHGWSDDPELQLLPYQKYAVNLGVYIRRFMLGDDMGLGKTPQAIAIMLKAWEEYDFHDGLIVCPTRLKKQWKSEIHKFTTLRRNQVELIGERSCRTGERTHFLKNCHACKGCKFFDACLFDAELYKSSVSEYRTLQIKRAKVLIAGYATVRMHYKDFMKHPYSVVIFDEATKMKNHKAEVSKNTSTFIHSLPPTAVVVPMSGTFIENRIEELYSVMQLVDPKILGGFNNFKTHYLVTDYWGNVVGYRNEKHLKKKLDRVLLRRTVDEVWEDRPPLVETVIECPLGKEQEKIYKDAREGVLTDIADIQKAKSINMANIAPLMHYLLQVATTLKSIDPDTKIKEHSSKFAVLKEMIEDEFPRKAKIVIFSRYSNKVIPYLEQDLKNMGAGKVKKLVGGISEKAQDNIINDFRENDEFRFLICSDALAYGGNFQFANYLVNVDLPWNPAVLDQRIRRVYRRGQKKTVTVINFIVPGTFEEHLYQVLAVKRKLFKTFLKESVTGGQEDMKALSMKELISLI
jgi:SNF2 family DNA or RNA helicase